MYVLFTPPKLDSPNRLIFSSSEPAFPIILGLSFGHTWGPSDMDQWSQT